MARKRKKVVWDPWLERSIGGLAPDLWNLGDEFRVYYDVEGERPLRPTLKLPLYWTWLDCYRSLVWGLSRRGVVVDGSFCAIVSRLAACDLVCLSVAADLLEESGCTDAAVLHLLRKPR